MNKIWLPHQVQHGASLVKLQNNDVHWKRVWMQDASNQVGIKPPLRSILHLSINILYFLTNKKLSPLSSSCKYVALQYEQSRILDTERCHVPVAQKLVSKSLFLEGLEICLFKCSTEATCSILFFPNQPYIILGLFCIDFLEFGLLHLY